MTASNEQQGRDDEDDGYRDGLDRRGDEGARIRYEATPAGARILPSISCPRCAVVVAADGIPHLCGDRAPKQKRSSPKPKAVRNA